MHNLDGINMLVRLKQKVFFNVQTARLVTDLMLIGKFDKCVVFY